MECRRSTTISRHLRSFNCDDERCTSHELQIQDWEIGQSFRRWARTDPDRWEEMIRQRYERDLPDRDLYLVVGNLAKRHQTFVIIGLVRPPRSKVDGGDVQQSLDLMGEQRPVAGQGIGLEAEEADALGGDEGDEPLELFPSEGQPLAVSSCEAGPIVRGDCAQWLGGAERADRQVPDTGVPERRGQRPLPEFHAPRHRRLARIY